MPVTAQSVGYRCDVLSSQRIGSWQKEKAHSVVETAWWAAVYLCTGTPDSTTVGVTQHHSPALTGVTEWLRRSAGTS